MGKFLANMNIKLLGESVLVERTVNDEYAPNRGGFVIVKNPENNGRTNEGYVRAVGEGRKHPRTGVILPMTVRVGDYVLFENHIKDIDDSVRNLLRLNDGKSYAIMKEEPHIIGILERKEK